MKKLFTLTATLLIMLLLAGISFADITYYKTGHATWWVADFNGDPTAPYSGNDHVVPDNYTLAPVVDDPHPNWTAGGLTDSTGALWVGPATGSGGDGSMRQGYTAYKTVGVQFIPDDPSKDALQLLCSADNAVTNLYIGIGNNTVDVFDSIYRDYVSLDFSHAGAFIDSDNYPEYALGDNGHYQGEGLFWGYLGVEIQWAELMSHLGWDSEGEFDFYFITQNTNPADGSSASGFIASFAGVTPSADVPEPASILLWTLGSLGALGFARRRNKKS